MRPLFQKLSKGPPLQTAESGIPRLTLGAFGKHPGWDDHMPGIGMETETLADVKQTLYVNGIGQEITSGAWEKLEAEKRLEGFAHTFLWLRGGHVVLGQMWSSKDGKGRAKYPMILAIDGESVTADFMLSALRGGLQNLREVCKGATTADEVGIHCRAAQEQLNQVLSGGTMPSSGAFALPDARRFLEHPELGPDRTGLLRVLHELARGFDISGHARAPAADPNASPRSMHLRVPFASDSEEQALLLWASFFREAVGPLVSLLLVVRAQTDWVDAIIGEPDRDDFFCLQASLKGLPLATQIPYELTSESRQRLPDLETRFLSKKPSAATSGNTTTTFRGIRAQLEREMAGGAARKPSVETAPAVVPRISSPPPAPPKAQAHPLPPVLPPPGSVAPPAAGKSKLPVAIGVLVLLLIPLVWLVSKMGSQSPAGVKLNSGERPARFTNSLGMEFVWFPALPGGGAYVGRCDVTRKQYRAVMKGLPEGEESAAGDDDLPVAGVTYEDAGKFCEQLSKLDRRTYALPSKDQWLEMTGLAEVLTNNETDVWNKLKEKHILDHEAVSLSEELKGPQKVGLGSEINGLCDLFGNVRQWIARGERAGLSFSCNGTAPQKGKLLFLDSSVTDAALLRESGLRCILQDKT